VTAAATQLHVTIKLFATFREGRFESSERGCAPGTTVGQLVRDLGIAPEDVGVLLVGGRHADLAHVAAGGETIAIFPLLGGG
jgi:molybdopterin converting factor small subunit